MNWIVTFKALVCRDLYLFTGLLRDKLINLFVWGLSTLFVFGHLMPCLGLRTDYYLFFVASSICLWGLFDVIENVNAIATDLESDSFIIYCLSLPLSSTMLLLQMVLSSAIRSTIQALMILTFFKMILFNSWCWDSICWPKFALMLITINIFYGCFMILLASGAQKAKITNVRRRFIVPLWLIGCYQFPWINLKKVLPVVAYIDLLNPVVYCMEGMRSVLLGQEGYLEYWYCFGALCCFSAVMGIIGFKFMKRRLDCL